MICETCEAMGSKYQGARATADGGGSSEPQGLCERCGRPLEPEVLERMAAKVDQLARFGLTGRPLLSRRRI